MADDATATIAPVDDVKAERDAGLSTGSGTSNSEEALEESALQNLNVSTLR
jgi:hypothetical protein